MRIGVSAAIKNLTINDVVHMDNLIRKDVVQLIIRGAKLDRLIENALDRNEFFKMKPKDEFLEAFTPVGLPLVFAFIDNEPSEHNEPWLFKSVFQSMLDQGLNPNQVNQVTGEVSLIYALK